MVATIQADLDGTRMRHARRTFLLAGGLSVLSLVALGWVIPNLLRAPREATGWVTAAVLISLLALCLRVLQTRWRLLGQLAIANASGHEDTGVWGVGGPNVRTPGATGLFRALGFDRTVHERDHDEHA